MLAVYCHKKFSSVHCLVIGSTSVCQTKLTFYLRTPSPEGGKLPISATLYCFFLYELTDLDQRSSYPKCHVASSEPFRIENLIYSRDIKLEQLCDEGYSTLWSVPLGLTVAGTAGTIEGMDLVKKVGADHVFNHREKGYLNNAVAAIGGHGFDIVLENLANVNLGADLTVLNQQARIAVSYINLYILLYYDMKRGLTAPF